VARRIDRDRGGRHSPHVQVHLGVSNVLEPALTETFPEATRLGLAGEIASCRGCHELVEKAEVRIHLLRILVVAPGDEHGASSFTAGLLNERKHAMVIGQHAGIDVRKPGQGLLEEALPSQQPERQQKHYPWGFAQRAEQALDRQVGIDQRAIQIYAKRQLGVVRYHAGVRQESDFKVALGVIERDTEDARIRDPSISLHDSD
jgi:hypothetical protein